MTKQAKQTEKKSSGYVCHHCKAFNTHGQVCGCQKSRIDADRVVEFAGAVEMW